MKPVSCTKKKNVLGKSGLVQARCHVNQNNLICSSTYTPLPKLKTPVLPLHSQGLSHFMELGERTDLLCSSPKDDPLGPDGFDDFHWVNVKQEFLQDVEVSKVTLTELPLYPTANQQNVEPVINHETVESTADHQTVETDIHKQTFETVINVNHSLEDHLKPKKTNFLEQADSGSDSWDQESNQDLLEKNETEDSQENSLQKKRKMRRQICDICGNKLSTKGSLRLHKMKKHQFKMQFSCELCGLKYDFQRDLIKHRNSVHKEEDGSYCCNDCSKRFLDYHSLLTHIRKFKHASNCKEVNESEHMCQVCDKFFDCKESLTKHQLLLHRIGESERREKLKNQEKNFTCDLCGKRFAYNCLLRDHINLHTGTKPYLCQKCGKAFAQKSTLKQHTKTHSEIRPFQCPECMMGFFVRGDLKKHLRKHSGERPFTCEVCGQGFSRSSHLEVHRRSHTGERPYECDVCQRAFTKRCDMVRHRRIHTGELPYLCQVCGRAFRQSTQCANHVKSQHPDSAAAAVNTDILSDHVSQRTYLQLI